MSRSFQGSGHSTVCLQRACISVWGSSLRAVPVSSRLYEDCRGCPCPSQGSGHSHSQLPRWLADPSSLARIGLCTQGHGPQPPSPIGTLGQLGKEQTVQRISFLGVELDLVTMTAHLSQDCAQSVLKCLRALKQKTAAPLKNFQRLPGHMASSATVTPLGLMHMRPLQHWLRTRVLRWAWHHGSNHVNITPLCHRTFSPWEDCRSALRTRVQMHYCYNRCFQDRLGRRVQRACSIRGLDRPSAALAYQLPGVIDSAFGLEEVSTLDPRQARVGPDGQHSDGCIHQPPGWCSIPSHVKTHPPSLTLEPAQTQVSACHSNPRRPQSCSGSPLAKGFAQGQVEASPQTVQLIWSQLDQAQVELFASSESTHFQLWYSLTEAPLGTDALAHSWPRGLLKYPSPPVSLIAQTLCKVREDREQLLFVASYWPNRTWFSELVLKASVPPWQIPLRKDLLSQGKGTIWHPCPDLWNLHVWSLDATRRTFHQQWQIPLLRPEPPRRGGCTTWSGVFVNWCSSQGKDPRRCGIGSMLSFLQGGLDRHLSASTLNPFTGEFKIF